MSETDDISVRDEIVCMTNNLLMILRRIRAVVYSRELMDILNNTQTLPDMNELIQHPETLKVFHEYFSHIRSWFASIALNTYDAYIELKFVREQISKLLDDLDAKLNELS